MARAVTLARALVYASVAQDMRHALMGVHNRHHHNNMRPCLGAKDRHALRLQS